jgi:type VI secretion system protein ImpJ
VPAFARQGETAVDFLQKVLWTEGLFLTPHHFQQLDRYHEYRLKTAIAGLQPLYWGLRALKVDKAALTDGNFALHACKGVMPDGLLFDVPDFDDIPATRNIASSFSHDKPKVGVYLAAPVARAGFAASKEEAVLEGIPPRFRAKDVRHIDAMGLTGDREVTVAKATLRILFEGEPLDGHTSLRIAEVVRTATGSFALSENYVPPSLYLSASEFVPAMLRRLLEVLSTRSGDLSLQRRQRAEGLVDFTMSEAANFWLLHTINGAIPPLLHLYNRGTAHPETLYLELVRLAGFLFTFAGTGHPKDIPPYVHDDLSGTFQTLNGQLLKLIETVIPTHCVPIPLERGPDKVYAGRITDEKLRKTGRFFLAVKCAMPDEKLVAEVPRKAKVTSSNRIGHLMSQFLRGMELRYHAVPPKVIPVQPGQHFFEIEKQGEHWEGVAASGAIALFFPPEFVDLHLEMMAIKE